MESIVTVLLCVYLAATLRYSGGIYGFLKLFLFAHVFGDFISDDYWTYTQTNYNDLRDIPSDVRLYGNLYLGIAIFAADVGFLLVRRYLMKNDRVVHYGGQCGFGVSKPLGLTLLVVGFSVDLFIASKVGFLYVTPSETVGYYGLYGVANTLIPIGAGAFFGLNIIPAMVVFLVASLFSYSKAQAVISLLLYLAYCAYGYGIVRLRAAVVREIFSVKGVAIVLIMITLIGARVVTRSGGQMGDVAIDGLARNIILATDARFLGGIRRTYLAATDEVLSGRMETMEGYYHFQTLYLWIPHALWKDKPPVASQEVYFYVHAIEPYGTSFAINPFGYLLIDYGLFGAWFGMLLLGAGLAYIEGRLVRGVSHWSTSEDKRAMGAGFIAVWVALSFPLSEAGIPPLILLGGSYSVACVVGFLAYRAVCLVGPRRPFLGAAKQEKSHQD